MNTTQVTKQRGRPPAFNYEDALQKAMQVFWSYGYEGASMATLTEAMGINKPSLYGAFGSKEALFRKVVEQYLSGPVAFVSVALKATTAREVVEKLLTQVAEFLSNPAHPKGCMVIQGALTCGQGAEAIQHTLISQRQGYEQALRQRFMKAQAEHDLSPTADPAALAKYIATIHQGMSVQATSGATKEELMQIVAMVLKSWPERD